MSDEGRRLELSTETRGEVTVMRVCGEVDLANAAELGAALRAVATPQAALVLDLAQVPFMDSSGLREVLVVSEQLGGRLAVVVEPDSAVGHLLEIAEVAERINVEPTEEAAAAALGEGGGDSG